MQTNQSRINRREFTIKSLGSLAALYVYGSGREALGQDGKACFAFVSDTHMTGVNDDQTPPNGLHFYGPHNNFSRLIEQINASEVEGAVITGDLARLEGFEADYGSLKQRLEPLHKEIPLFLGLGNHDRRENFRKVFGADYARRSVGGDRIVHVVENGPIRLIVLDSLLPGVGSGYLGGAQRRWLIDYLDRCDDRPTALCFHHTLADREGHLLDSHALFALAAPRRKVKALIFGHSHQYRFEKRDDLHLINLPGCGYSFNSREPVGWAMATFTKDGCEWTRQIIDGPDPDEKQERHALTWRVSGGKL